MVYLSRGVYYRISITLTVRFLDVFTRLSLMNESVDCTLQTSILYTIELKMPDVCLSILH